MEYQEILKLSDKYERCGDSLKLRSKAYPWSIKQAEFNYMYNHIIENNLKNGYECATGTGISSLAIGLAMKKTGGKVVTMDAFSEELFSNYNVNTPHLINHESQGQNALNDLISKLDLSNQIKSVVGWSPTDTVKNLKEHYNLKNEKLDLVFIDACHLDEAIIKDVEVLMPYLSKKCSLFFHDLEIGDGITLRFKEWLRTNFGKTYEIVVPQPYGYNLGLLKLE